MAEGEEVLIEDSDVLKMVALIYQIHMKLEVVLLSRFEFRLGCLESL